MRRLTLLLPLAVALGCGARSQPTPTDPAPPDLDFPVGSFSFTERSGKTVTDADLKGKVWIAGFIFTRCSGPCPHVTATMRSLQKDLPARDDLRLVTFTIDGSHDNTGRLQQYANRYGADPERWLFLTGDEKAVHKLLRERFQGAAARRTGPDVKEGETFDHTTRLTVVDRKGVIRAVFDGLPSENFPDANERFEENLTRLKDKVTKLLEE
jgi:cytochrome oxidase Cu insertion factor (SCO1/SenC/PrrC family)